MGGMIALIILVLGYSLWVILDPSFTIAAWADGKYLLIWYNDLKNRTYKRTYFAIKLKGYD